MLHEEAAEKVIQAFHKVYNTRGYGLIEKACENALAYELRKAGHEVDQQEKVEAQYDGHKIGDNEVDMIVDNLVIMETKAKEGLREEHQGQLLNYLKATQNEVGPLMNFGKKPEFCRMIFTNEFKAFRVSSASDTT